MDKKLHVKFMVYFPVFHTGTMVSRAIKMESKELVGGAPKNLITMGGYVKLVAAYDYLGLPNGSSFNMIEMTMRTGR